MEKLLENLFLEEENVFGVEEIKNLVFKEYKGKFLAEAAQASNQQERTLKLPKLQISENWGKASGVDRQELERIVDSATRGQGNVFDKLKIIQQQMNVLSSGQLGKIKNPRRILSQIMLLETMNRLFKSFQPAPAGFINEAFLSVFYGGVQTAAGKANLEKDIGDVTDPDGTPISIKTKGKGGLMVDGSIENLYTSINKAKKVYFDIYEKNIEGKGTEGSHVGSFKLTRFIVDANNVNQFLGKKYFDVQDGKLIPLGQFKKGGKDVESLDEARGPSMEEIVNTLVASNKEMSPKEIKKALGPYFEKPKLRVDIFKALKEKAVAEKDPAKKQIMTNNISAFADLLISLDKLEKVSGGMEREFAVPETHWRKFADQQKFLEPIEITFSDAQINKVLQNAVQELDKQIVEIFNSLDGFSQSINTYLTSLSPGRGEQGAVALQYAKKLEPQTKQVIKTVSADDESNV